MNETDLRREHPTLVFVHHFGGAGRSWDALTDRLRPRFECLTPDLAGFGGSSAPPTPDLQAFASQLEAITDLPYVLVGHSMGAKIGMALAARRPAGLRGMVLVAPSPPTPEPMEEDERRSFLAEHGDRAKARTRIGGLTGARLEDAVERAYVDDQVGVDAAVWRWWLQDGSRVDLSSSLIGLDLPVLVIAAADDPILPLQSIRDVADRFAGSRFEVLGKSGHLAPEERPGELAHLIEAFADALGSTS